MNDTNFQNISDLMERNCPMNGIPRLSQG